MAKINYSLAIVFPSLLLLSLAMLPACSAKKSLDEMHDSTVQMNETTKQMNDTTKQMANTTGNMSETMKGMAKDTNQKMDGMNTQLGDMKSDLKTTSGKLDKMSEKLDSVPVMAKTTTEMAGDIRDMKSELSAQRKDTEELFDALRQGNGMLSRETAWAAMIVAPTLVEKISKAGKYFMGFEYQLWNNMGQDEDPDRRDILMAQAAEEFFLELKSLNLAGDVDVEAVKTSEYDIKYNTEGNRMASFNALAITIHKNNRKQMELVSRLKKTDSKQAEISMLSIMKEALLSEKFSDAQMRNQSVAKRTMYGNVLTQKRAAIAVLQTRYTLLPLVVFQQFTNLENWFSAQAKGAFGWDMDLNKITSVEAARKLNEELLVQALDAGEFLKQIGVTPERKWTLQRLINVCNIKNIPSDKDQSELAKIKLEIAKNITKLKSNGEALPSASASVSAKSGKPVIKSAQKEKPRNK